MRMALVIAVVLLAAPVSAKADTYSWDLDLDFDFSDGVSEMMLYVAYGTADVAVTLVDIYVDEPNRNLGVADVLVGGSQVLVYGYKALSDDERTGIDAIMVAAGTLVLARGVYLSVRPVERKPTFVPTMVGGRPGIALAGKF